MIHPPRIMIIRHAEKPFIDQGSQINGVNLDGSQDNEALVVRGWQRAGALSVLFGPAGLAQSRGLSVPQVLYASAPEKTNAAGSHSLRSEQTLLPLAERLGLAISLAWIKGQEAGLVKDVLNQTGTVLVAWQHEVIPSIAAAIPGGNVPQTRTWADDRFDLVWIFDLLPDGTYRFKEIHQALLPGDLDV